MKRPAIFFDRDNTLIINDDYLGDPAQVKLVKGAAEAVARARALGYATIVFSNQSGVARGHFTEDAVHAVNKKMDDLLCEQNPNAIIDRHEFCPYHPQATVDAYRQESDRRKPSAGMIHQAAEALALDLARSWVIGDAARDIQAGHTAGLRTILFCDPALNPSPAALSNDQVQPTYCVTTLKEALDHIEKAQHDSPPTPTEPVAPPPPPKPETSTKPRVAESTTQSLSTNKLESLAAEILRELRHQRDHRPDDADFSVTKLLAGIVQILVLAVLLIAYLNRNEPRLFPLLMLALIFQTMTIALLIMGRQH
jgi:D-glycero-D-manno-heptose 1,7-bisphosphate phosphatase